jgi:hypothetical protein
MSFDMLGDLNWLAVIVAGMAYFACPPAVQGAPGGSRTKDGM